ncbi:MAG: winged helix-turn-helix transcriptional regulator [Bacillota bacterium]
MYKHKGRSYNYRIEMTMDYLGGKWKALLIFYLYQKPFRFNELKRYIPDITQKMLTQQLREMEGHGLINRHVYQQVPPKVEYTLTELGRSLFPIVDMMCHWAKENLEFDEIIEETSEQFNNKP